MQIPDRDQYTIILPLLIVYLLATVYRDGLFSFLSSSIIFYPEFCFEALVFTLNRNQQPNKDIMSLR